MQVSRINAKMFRQLTDADFDAKHKFSFDMSVSFPLNYVPKFSKFFNIVLETNLHHPQSMISSLRITHHGFSGT